MKVLIVEPDYEPYEGEVKDLPEMQAVVGGRITAIYPFEERVGIVSNDDALSLRLPFNRSMEHGYGGVFGTFFVCGLGENDFCSLTPEQMERYKKKYHMAERLIAVDGSTPVTIKVDPLPKKRKGQGRKSRPKTKGQER